MTSITEKLAAALAEESSFIGPNPLHAALIECVKALADLEFECRNAFIEEQHVIAEMKNAEEALARLRECLGES